MSGSLAPFVPTEGHEAVVVVMTQPTPELWAEFANIDGPWVRGQMEANEVWKCLVDAQAEGTKRELAVELGRQWLPIETAPKVDYEPLLVVDTDLGVCLGYWAPDDDDIPGDWMAQDTAGEYCGDLTHWMPLPAAPDAVRDAEQVGTTEGREP